MRKRNKVIRLFSRLNIGGPAIHVVNLATGLKRFGYETTLVVGRPVDEEGSMENWAREQGAQLLRIDAFQAPISVFKDAKVFFSLLILFLRERPFIVHTHTFKAGVLGRCAAKCTGVPVIVHTYHGHLLTGYWGPLKTNVIRLVESALGKISNRVLAVSQKVGDDLIKAGIVPREKLSVIELGFDVSKLKSEFMTAPTLRKDLGLSEREQLVGIVGRLVPIKGIDLFLRALIPLLQEFPRLHLAIIGDGSEAESLKKCASEFDGDLSRIHFCGWRRPVVPDLRDLDVCVCSSRNEGTSVSVIEAIMAGIPVISTNVGGMGDLLAQGKWGDLVDYDENQLRQAVKRLLEILSHPGPDLDALRLRCREAANVFEQRFSVERLLGELDSLYGEMTATFEYPMGVPHAEH
jgi:glycosyltransferase involved in cell wall biosynthesis